MLELVSVATVLIVGLGGGSWWVGNRRFRELKRNVEAQHEALTEWAAAHGWTIGEGTDFRFAERADRVTGLAGEPGDWNIRVGHGTASREEPLKRWVFGSVLSHETPQGRILLVGCWHERSFDHHVFGAMSTDSVFEPYTVDLFENDTHQEGVPPKLSDGPTVLDTMLGLTPPVRLRLLVNEVLLSAPGYLPPALAQDLVDRLYSLNQRLPRTPGAGPQR